MKRTTWLIAVGVLLLGLCSTNATVAARPARITEAAPAQPDLISLDAAEASGTAQLLAFYAGEQRARDEAAAAQAEADRVAAEEAAARESARIAAAPSIQPVMTGGGCCGPHSDAWWSGVAQCEQGGRNDPYYGYFSFMDGSQGGKPWADQVAAGNALLARAGREVGPWAASCVAAGYNASPGG